MSRTALDLAGGGQGKRGYIGQRVHYEGRVYCATVPNGTLIVRRGGKTFIAGNCWVYAYAAAHHPELHLHRFRIADWAAAEARIAGLGAARQPVAVDPEKAPETAASPVKKPEVPPAAAPKPQRARVSRSTYLR